MDIGGFIDMKLQEYEISLLKNYLKLPVRKLLNHKFEIEEDYIAGHVQRFLKGERFNFDFIAFSEKELDYIKPVLSNNISSNEGKDLYTAICLTKIVCNIMNKYKV